MFSYWVATIQEEENEGIIRYSDCMEDEEEIIYKRKPKNKNHTSEIDPAR